MATPKSTRTKNLGTIDILVYGRDVEYLSKVMSNIIMTEVIRPCSSGDYVNWNTVTVNYHFKDIAPRYPVTKDPRWGSVCTVYNAVVYVVGSDNVKSGSKEYTDILSLVGNRDIQENEVPVLLYVIHEDQAKELKKSSVRKNLLLHDYRSSGWLHIEICSTEICQNVVKIITGVMKPVITTESLANGDLEKYYPNASAPPATASTTTAPETTPAAAITTSPATTTATGTTTTTGIITSTSTAAAIIASAAPATAIVTSSATATDGSPLSKLL